MDRGDIEESAFACGAVMTMNGWMKEEIARLSEAFGDVPPPWVLFPDTHPYSICWRMGAGESHIEVWGEWWDSQRSDEAQRIAYFRRWPPPPMWLFWTICSLWDLRSWELPEDFDDAPYFARMEGLGFGSKSDYEKDLNDPRWLASESDE